MASNLFVRTPSLFEPLTKIILGEVDCSLATLARYSVDDSPYQVSPQTVIYPKNTTDIKHVIAFAKEYSLPITTCGGRSGGAGGVLGEGIILDLTRYFTGIKGIHVIENTVTVEAGVRLQTLCETLRARNLELPLLLDVDSTSTVGGFVATMSTTSSTFYYGGVREWIEGMTIVVDNGEEHHIRDGITPSGRLLGIYQALFPTLTEASPILRANKPENKDDATGYNLWSTSIGPRQLIDELVGSEGTLGIITSVTFRITPRIAHSITTEVALPTIQALSKCITAAKEHKANSLYFYDVNFKSLLSRFASPYREDISSALPYTLIVTHRNNNREVLESTVATWKNFCTNMGNTVSVLDETKVSLLRSFEFHHKTLNAYTDGNHHIVSITNGIVVSLENHPLLLEAIQNYISNSGKLYTLTGYGGSGHIALTLLLDPKSPEYERELFTIPHDIFVLVKKHKGGISIEGGDGISRTPYLPIFYNEAACRIFKQIKEIWDPNSLFNPSHKVDLSSTYLTNHLRRA